MTFRYPLREVRREDPAIHELKVRAAAGESVGLGQALLSGISPPTPETVARTVRPPPHVSRSLVPRRRDHRGVKRLTPFRRSEIRLARIHAKAVGCLSTRFRILPDVCERLPSVHMPGMDRIDEGPDREGFLRSSSLVVLLGTVIRGVADLYFDAPDNWRSPHAIHEMAFIAAAIAQSSFCRADGGTPVRNSLNRTGEIALRLLKGHRHKQIAFETGRGARTVRQHPASGYQKSGLSGRAELAAFFLDDPLLPGHATPDATRVLA